MKLLKNCRNKMKAKKIELPSIKEGQAIKGSYYFGEKIKSGIGFIHFVGETPYASLALHDGGVTQQELYSLREFEFISFGVGAKGG